MNSPLRVRVVCAGPTLRPGPGPIVVPAVVYDVDVLRTALRRGDLGAELPLLAVLRPSVSDPKQTPTTDRYQRGAYADPHKNPEKMVDGPSVIAPPLMMGYCLRLLQGVLRA